MKIALTLPYASMPRTVFYERFLDALRRRADFVEDESAADLLFPAEDTAMETNWPRLGDQVAAFVRGQFEKLRYQAYFNRLEECDANLCVINMHPFIRIPKLFGDRPRTVVADGCLSVAERQTNPRTISMPARPIIAGDGEGKRERGVLASFRGAVSHPCREELLRLHDGVAIICQSVDPADTATKSMRAEAWGMMSIRPCWPIRVSPSSLRGDSLFSYRLLEVMSFGCVPVVITDGWVLPLDRTIDWDAVAVRIDENRVCEAREYSRVYFGRAI